MNVTSLSFTRRFNLENRGGYKYEHEEITVEVLPEEGETAETLLTRTRAFVDANSPGKATSAPVTTGQPAPPLKGKGSDPTAASSTPAPSSSGSPKAAPKPDVTPPKKRGRGRPPKALTEAKAAVEAVQGAIGFESLLDAMNAAAEKASAFTPDEWRTCCKGFKDKYAELNTAAEDPKVGEALVKWFHKEWTAIEEKTHWS